MFASTSGRPSADPKPQAPPPTADIPPNSSIFDQPFSSAPSHNLPTTGATGIPAVATSTPLPGRRVVGGMPEGSRTMVGDDTSFRSAILTSSMLNPPAASQSRSEPHMPGAEPDSPPSTSSSRGTIHERPPPTPEPAWTGIISRKVVVRTDPGLVTCFDPADAELYKLWVQS